MEITFDREHDGSLSLASAVFQALGAASVCWESMDGTGVFQSDRASAIGDALVELLGGDRQLVPVADRGAIEEIAADVHSAWMAAKRSQGITSRVAESGEDLMVPYAQLSEQAKELDRATVRAVLAAPAHAAAFRPNRMEALPPSERCALHPVNAADDCGACHLQNLTVAE